MKYAILLIAAAITILGTADVFADNNQDRDTLVSCRRSKDQSPVNSTSDRSGA
ncbi:hypothetical protein IQ276_029805 [Desmonostoc muscorum LEGE 12446]|uniref:Uncharacterized protein n=1 Tax=Desmonostoc muscorum LEGE 12446 TaxID=1828758 RepID=A0A8J7DGP1_DESMC|nr:hypothetical protein [Desmonostoc muscorum]MCF2150547.1 hypothetical protein [Desmonostoc muscorum LEGE 12446]